MDHLWSPWRMHYIESHNKPKGCVFCNALQQTDAVESLIVYRGELGFAILNRYPYTSGHLMVVPYSHCPNLTDLDAATRTELMELANQGIQVLTEIYHPQAFNVGINIGAAAGAGVADHIHMHVVPRWGGDANFMSTVGQTRVIPEALEDTFRRIKDAWEKRYR